MGPEDLFEESRKFLDTFPSVQTVHSSTCIANDIIASDCDILIWDLDSQAFPQDIFQTNIANPVVIVMSSSLSKEVSDFVESHAYDLLLNPVNPVLFRAAVRRAIQHVEILRYKHIIRKQAEESVHAHTLELSRRKEFLNGILNSSTLVSVILTDLEQNILFWNKGAENIFGYTSEEMVGSKVTKLYPPDPDSSGIVSDLQHRVIGRGETVHGKMNQIAKDGRIVTVSLAISPMMDPETGNLMGILGIGQDITEEYRLSRELQESFRLLKGTQDVSVFSLAKLAESRDQETGDHLFRIQAYCRILCEKLSEEKHYDAIITTEFTDNLVRASVLHDIGKVALPDAILMCTGRFTPEQRAAMQQHPVHGGKALDDAVALLGEESFLSMGRDIAYYHHEKWDGSGYPFGLKGTEIPLSARIVALADVYDALTSRRRYKEGFSHEEAVSLIVKEENRQFDRDIITAFLGSSHEFNSIRETFRQ